jgi:hypothetical protein
MKATLADWYKNGWLKEHQTSRQEIADLFAVADRDLAASQTPGLTNDWRFNIAYNAALQLATAALAAAGYRADRSNHHYRVIQSLELTLGVDQKTIRAFDMFRKKRHITDYERVGAVSDLEVESMRRLASKLRAGVLAWIATEHPSLNPHP